MTDPHENNKYSDEVKIGAFRESNSGPLAPKARIIPLDQMPGCWNFVNKLYIFLNGSRLHIF